MLCILPTHTESKTSEAFILLIVGLFTQNFVAQHLYTSKTFRQLCNVKYQHNWTLLWNYLYWKWVCDKLLGWFLLWLRGWGWSKVFPLGVREQTSISFMKHHWLCFVGGISSVALKKVCQKNSMDLWGCTQRKDLVAINLWRKKTVRFQMRTGTAAPYCSGTCPFHRRPRFLEDKDGTEHGFLIVKASMFLDHSASSKESNGASLWREIHQEGPA